MVKIGGDWYLIGDNWNGEYYISEKWKFTKKDGFKIKDSHQFCIIPVYVGEGEPDEDGDYMGYEIIGYTIRY